MPAFVNADAVLCINADLRIWFYTLRIAAPLAFHGAAFKKYLRSDTGTIMNGIALDVENITKHFMVLVIFCHDHHLFSH